MQSSETKRIYLLAEFLNDALGPSFSFAFYPIEDSELCEASFFMGEVNLQQRDACTEQLGKIVQDCDIDDINNYSELSNDGAYKYNFFFMKREDTNPMGVFVILDNMGAKTQLLSEIEDFLNLKSKVTASPPARNTSLADLSTSSLSKLVHNLLHERGMQSNGSLTPEQKKELVLALREKGVFKLKGSIPIVAQLLNTSSPTIYRYLSQINYQENTGQEVQHESIRLL